MKLTVFVSLAVTFVSLNAVSGNVVVMRNDPLAEDVTFTLTVFNEMTRKKIGQYTVGIKPGMTLYKAMVQLQRQQPTKFSFDATFNEQAGHTIVGINGVYESPEDKLSWGLYIFNEFWDKGVDHYRPEKGDQVVWKYMKHFSANVSVIDAIHGNKTLFSDYLDGISLGTCLYEMMNNLERRSRHEFNFVTSGYPRMGHFIEAIQGVWHDYEIGRYWAIYINDEYVYLDKGVECIIPDDGDHIKFTYI